MKRLLRMSAAHPVAVLTILMLLSALALQQTPGLRVSVSAESMLERGTPAWEYFVSTEQTFGTEDVIIVVLRDPEVFAEANLLQVRDILREIEKLPGVTGTSSLFDTKNLKNIDDTIHIKPFLETLPTGPEEVAAIRLDAIRNPLVLGNLISADGKTLALNVYVDREKAGGDFDHVITVSIESLIAPLRAHIDHVYQVGTAAMRDDLTSKVRSDQQVFLPLSVAVLLVTLAFGLRRANAALMPLATAGISVLWTLGFMAWMGIPVNIMTSIVPALVIIIGSTEDIHLLAEYAAGIRDGLSRPAAIAQMADRMGVAVLLTFVTTYLGFFSIALNDIQLLYQFGLVASTGLLFNFVITVTLVPAMLGLLGHREEKRVQGEQGPGWFQHGAVAVLNAAHRHRALVLWTAAAVAIVAWRRYAAAHQQQPARLPGPGFGAEGQRGAPTPAAFRRAHVFRSRRFRHRQYLSAGQVSRRGAKDPALHETDGRFRPIVFIC